MLRTPGGIPRRWLLVSDLDDTLLATRDGEPGDDAAFYAFVDSLVARPDILLVVNSSRPRGSVLATLSHSPVVRRVVRRLNFSPDGLITAMGTEILLVGEASDLAGDALARWQARFDGWDRGYVDAAMARFEERGVVPHSAEYQAPFKASFAVPEAMRDKVVESLRALDQPSRIIVSGKTDVDVLPPNAGKGEATRFVADVLGINRASGLIVAGDSGNDLEMFAESKKGIVVANARAELADAVNPDCVYRSKAARAAGLIEGLIHWGALPSGNPTTHQANKDNTTS